MIPCWYNRVLFPSNALLKISGKKCERGVTWRAQKSALRKRFPVTHMTKLGSQEAPPTPVDSDEGETGEKLLTPISLVNTHSSNARSGGTIAHLALKLWFCIQMKVSEEAAHSQSRLSARHIIHNHIPRGSSVVRNLWTGFLRKSFIEKQACCCRKGHLPLRPLTRLVHDLHSKDSNPYKKSEVGY